MKHILATTALVALTAMPVFAQNAATDPATAESLTINDMQVSAEQLIDGSLYASTVEVAPGLVPSSIDAPAEDWDTIGPIEDLIMAPDGSVVAIVLDAGSYFDLGARQVSVPIEEITLVTDTSNEGEMFIVYNGTAAELEDLPELDRSAVTDQGNAFYTAGNPSTGSDQGQSEQEVTEVPPAPNDDAATGSTIDPASGEEDAAMNDPATDEMATDGASDGDNSYLQGDELAALTANDLQGAAVHDMAGERVGNISDIILTDDGLVDNVIVDVGGFLGIGAKSVAIAFEDLQFEREDGAMSSSLRAVTIITADQFSAMEEWDG